MFMKEHLFVLLVLIHAFTCMSKQQSFSCIPCIVFSPLLTTMHIPYTTSQLGGQLVITNPTGPLPCSRAALHYRPFYEENIRNRIKCDDVTVARMLTPYVLTPEKRALMGYPVEAWKGARSAIVTYTPYPTNNPTNNSDVNSIDATEDHMDDDLRKIKCCRCSEIFFLDTNNNYVRKDQCVYHWGKCLDKIIDDTNQGVIKRWTCCNGEAKSPGCTVEECHVWTGLRPGINALLNGYMRTKEPEIRSPSGFYGVYGLDCEMCYTRNGLEIIQVALVDMHGTTVYTTYVKPTDEIIDYNTRFSGITANDLQNVTKTLSDVHEEIATFIHKDTILIGHSLEGDLRALRLLHEKCIDTSAIFPHEKGLPYRNGLRSLSKRVLARPVQLDTHDPAEDARTAIDLMCMKLYIDNIQKIYSKDNQNT